MGRTLLRAPCAIVDGRFVRDAAVLCEDGQIVTAGSRTQVEPAADATIELDGTLLPGLVDLQVNGMGGRGCDEAEPDALEQIAATAWRGGAAAFLPTLITAPFDLLCERARGIAAWIATREARADAATPLGIHLEGPFLEVPGAHDPAHFVDPSPARITSLLEACGGSLRLVTLAPSLPSAAAATAQLRAADVAVAFGHARTIPGFDDCVAAGARGVTHLFNAMGGLSHREPGFVGRCLDEPRLGCSLICDGAHLDPAIVRLAYRVLGVERTILVTDATNAAGMPDGRYELSGMPVRAAHGVVRDAAGRLAGSALTMSEACRNLAAFVHSVAAAELAAVASANPARLIAATQFGVIRSGAVARFALLGSDAALRAFEPA